MKIRQSSIFLLVISTLFLIPSVFATNIDKVTRSVAVSDNLANQPTKDDTTNNESIKPDPNPADTYYKQGLKRQQSRDYKGAIAEYNQAIQINPTNADFYFSRGLALSKLGDQKAAIADFDQAIKVSTNKSDAYFKRGTLRLLLADDPKLITADLNEAIKINPNNADAYYLKGTLRLLSDDKKGAIQDMGKAAELYGQQGYTAKQNKTLEAMKNLQN